MKTTQNMLHHKTANLLGTNFGCAIFCELISQKLYNLHEEEEEMRGKEEKYKKIKIKKSKRKDFCIYLFFISK